MRLFLDIWPTYSSLWTGARRRRRIVIANRHLQRTPQHSRSTGSCAFNGTFAQSVSSRLRLDELPTDALRRDGVHRTRFLNGSHTGVGVSGCTAAMSLTWVLSALLITLFYALAFWLFRNFYSFCILIGVYCVPLGRPAGGLALRVQAHQHTVSD